MPIGKLYEPPAVKFTPVLNAGLKREDLRQPDRDAFKRPGKKVKLPAGFRLYKFTQGEISSPYGVTPWWSPVKAYEWDPGLAARLHLADHLGTDAVDLTRVVAAVRTNWNLLTFLLTSVLLKDLYCFWGQGGWQPREGNETLEELRRTGTETIQPDGKRKVRKGLPGNASQFFMPNMQLNVHIKRDARVSVADLKAGRAVIF